MEGCTVGVGVLACESVVVYVQAAQRRLGTDYPVFVLCTTRIPMTRDG